MGWIGTWSELSHALRMFGCDRDEQGRFKVDGTICSFMGGGQEYVVGDDAIYYVDGQPRLVVQALKATSYGHHVHVI